MRLALTFGTALLTACNPVGDGAPTWNHDVLPLFEEHCTTCHTDGGLGPMPLQAYEHVKVASQFGDGLVWESLPYWLEEGLMPPANPMAECIETYGGESLFLDESELQTVLDWVEADIPEGDGEPRHFTPPASPVDALGEPDLVVRRAEPYQPSYGSDGSDYACFRIDPGLTETKLIGAITPFLDNKRVVHHMLLFRGPPDGTDTCSGEEMLSDMLAGWAPGQEGWFLPEGVAYELEPSDGLMLQIHYDDSQDNGKPDQSGLGLHFVDSAEHEAGVMWTGTIFAPEGEPDGGFGEFIIPAGATDYEVGGACTVTEAMGPITVFGVWPHMHEIGKSLNATMYPGLQNPGDAQCLVDVSWDFDDQRGYQFVHPVEMVPGDRIETTCLFDNPNSFDVRFGEETDDEMCFDFVMYYPALDQQYCLF